MHDDVGAQCLLHRDRPLGRQLDPAAVDVAAEGDARIVDLPYVSEAVDLEPAGVGEDGPVPGHEFVQAAEFGHAPAQFDIRATSCHIGRDGNPSRLAGAGDDLRFLGVADGVEDLVVQLLCLEQPA